MSDRANNLPEAQEPDELTDEELEDLNSAEHDQHPIVYSGQDFDVNGLVRRLRNDDIVIPSFGQDDESIVTAGFQRSFVWSRNQMDRFVESILLGYPIPGIFLIRQTDKRYLVLDGQQRLTTLLRFEDGLHAGKEFSLKNVSDDFKKLTYKKLSDQQRRQFDDTFIQATIVATDGSTHSLDSIYQIFERLNSGGTQLTPHEIRVALYAGPIITFIEELNSDEKWRELYGNRSKRIRDQELALRVLAIYQSAENYKRPLKTFLNKFVGDNRDATKLDTEKLAELFNRAAGLLLALPEAKGVSLSGRRITAALTEATMVGLMRRLAHPDRDPVSVTTLSDAVDRLLEDEEFMDSVSRATADEERVRIRLEKAIAQFDSL